MFARFDENPAMTLRVIKETKRYGRTDGRTDNEKTVYPLQTKFAGGYNLIGPCMAYNSISIKHYIKSHLELQREITLIELAPSPYFFV